MNEIYFPNMPGIRIYWSSTTRKTRLDVAWAIEFRYGADAIYLKFKGNYLRSVRGGL